MNKKGFGANSVLEGAGFFLAVFLLLTVLVKFVFFPSVVYADESAKSLLSLEHTLNWASEQNPWPGVLSHPMSISDGNHLVSFNRGYAGDDRNPECGSVTQNSCLCICEDEECTFVFKCVGFKQFNEINMRKIPGSGRIVSLRIEKTDNGISIKQVT